MKLKEMQLCADEVLALFIRAMPGVPFGSKDIEIQFAPKKDMVARFKSLCEKYAPERLHTLTNDHFEQLENQTFGNAIIGRDKSAAIIRINYTIDADNLRRIVFHELMHIYCGKTEMDGEHFIDIYGCGHTPDLDPEDKVYDGQVSAGYAVWSEFIAEYFAMMKTAPRKHWFSDITDLVFNLLAQVRFKSDDAKTSFAMMCAYTLTCADADTTLLEIANLSDGSTNGQSAMEALRDCLVFLREHVRGDAPCKIMEEFICELGCKYLAFMIKNSVYLGVL